MHPRVTCAVSGRALPQAGATGKVRGGDMRAGAGGRDVRTGAGEGAGEGAGGDGELSLEGLSPPRGAGGDLETVMA